MTHADAVVAGAGVIGLTTAISLTEAGLSTRIVTAGPGPGTTSVAAGAIWGPVRCGPPDRTYSWSAAGLKVLSSLAVEPSAGIRQVSGYEVAASPASPEDWLNLVPDMRLLVPSELPDGMVSGWRYTAPVVTMPVYLEYLRTRYEALGGTIEVSPSVYPVRGQVVVVENPGIDEFYIDHTLHGFDYVYIFPHGDVALLGGTAEEGAWDLSPRPEVAERIVADCSRVNPRLRGARVVAERVGLRPCRPTVRLEAEALPGGRVLWHNYGHGGAGVTLSWGCAAEITEAVLR
jgi:D-amino-acid oxidase